MPEDLLEKAKAMQARYSTTERDKREKGREKLREKHPELVAFIDMVEKEFGTVTGIVKLKDSVTRS